MQHDVNPTVISVAVDAPQHSGLTGALDYGADRPWPPGTLLRVPLGKRELLGIVWHGAAAPAGSHALRPVGQVFADLPAMAPAWLALVDFAASYYQRSVGELALSVLPPELRKLDAPGLSKRLARLLRKLEQAPAPATRMAVSRATRPGAAAGAAAGAGAATAAAAGAAAA
ncbi:MAG: primosomal protein N', partial [Microbacteriaceae bacterium]|nr:primosomal protein N' [Burkholderiaceae bacterium]